jgi:hypothetical protein
MMEEHSNLLSFVLFRGYEEKVTFLDLHFDFTFQKFYPRKEYVIYRVALDLF